jgi:heptosyltransferase-2
MYPYDYYIELGEQLTLNGFRILLFGGKSEKQLCELIAKSIPNAMNLCSDNDLYQTAADMSLCKAIVSNDSGLMHVAAAMQVPTVAIFGSSVRQFGFTPYRNKHIIIENTLAKCRPCSHYGKENCPRAHFECMLRITPTMVYQNLVTFLSQR